MTMPSGTVKRECDLCGQMYMPWRHTQHLCGRRCGALWGRGVRESARYREPTPTRKRRESLQRRAPGLTRGQLRKLLTVWKSQRRTCIYCGDIATTVEHLLPLSRGGTNREGNLAPSCARCNYRKQDRTVAEFRLGRKPKRQTLGGDYIAAHMR